MQADGKMRHVTLAWEAARATKDVAGATPETGAWIMS